MKYRNLFLIFIVVVIVYYIGMLYGNGLVPLSNYKVERITADYDDFGNTPNALIGGGYASAIADIGNTILCYGDGPYIIGIRKWDWSTFKFLGNFQYFGEDYGNSIVASINPGITDMVINTLNNRVIFTHGSKHFLTQYDLNTNTYFHLSGISGSFGYAIGNSITARYNGPNYIDSWGNTIFVSDRFNHVIKAIYLPTRECYLIAGIPGQSGYVDGALANARFNTPKGIVVSENGNTIYVCDQLNVVRAIDLANNTVYTIASVGSNNWDIAIDNQNKILYTVSSDVRIIYKINLLTGNVSSYTSGDYGEILPNVETPVSSFKFRDCRSICLSSDNSMLFMGDYSSKLFNYINLNTNKGGRLLGYGWWVTNYGSIKRMSLSVINGADYYGNTLVISAGSTRMIYKVYENGMAEAIAGAPDTFGSVDGYFGSSRLGNPVSGVVSGDYYYFYDMCTIRRVNLINNYVETLCGAFNTPGCVDGIGTSVRLNSQPGPSCIDVVGNTLYYADGFNHVVRKLNLTTMEMTTIAGVCGQSENVDGYGLTTNCRINGARAISIDPNNPNYLYLVTLGGYIRFIDLTGNSMTTVYTGIPTDSYRFLVWYDFNNYRNFIFHSPNEGQIKQYNDITKSLTTIFGRLRTSYYFEDYVSGNTYTSTIGYQNAFIRFIKNLGKFLFDTLGTVNPEMGGSLKLLQVMATATITNTFTTNTMTPTFTITPSFTMTPCFNINSAHVYYLDNSTNDLISNSSFIIMGSGLYYTSVTKPSTNVSTVLGGFNSTSFLRADSILLSNLSNRETGGIHFWWYPTNLNNEQILFTYQDNILNKLCIAVSTSGKVKLIFESGSWRDLTPDGVISSNNWYEFLFEWDKYSIYFSINGVLYYRGYGMHGLNKWTGNLEYFIFGGRPTSPYSIEYPISGYLSSIHILTNHAPICKQIIDSCNQTLIPTATYYKTYMHTPTPFATFPTPCGTPYPKVWTVIPTPIITPNATAGILYCGEPDIIYHELDGKYHMIVSHEDFTKNPPKSYIKLHTSTDMINWDDRGILVGGGICNIQLGAMGKQVVFPDKDRLYFSDRTNPGVLYRIDSYNYGYNYVTSTLNVAINVNALSEYSLYPHHYARLNSTAVFRNPVDNKYYAITELDASSSFGWYYPQYVLWLWKSDDNGDSFYPISPVSLVSIPNFNLGPIWAHPRSLIFDGLLWHMWIGVGYEGPIVHTQSYDLYNWKTDNLATAYYWEYPQFGWLPNPNQIGDTGGLVMYNGKLYIPFVEECQDGSCGVIGLMVYDGSIQKFANCGTEVPTYTFTLTRTFTLTPTFTSTLTLITTPTNTLTSTITPTAYFYVKKSSDKSIYNYKDTITYTLEVNVINQAEQLQLWDTIPSGINFIWSSLGYIQNNNYISISRNANQWSFATTNAPWAAAPYYNYSRSGHKVLYYNDYIWLLGGRTNVDKNDVWKSSDGVDWVLATGNAAWSPSSFFATTVHNGKMYVITGNEVWYSTNGIDWIAATRNAEFGRRSSMQVLSFNNKLFLLFGIEAGTTNFKNDVWSSTDGVIWVQETANSGVPPRGNHAAIVWNNKMWVLGGENTNYFPYATFKDVWYSTNGVNWIAATENAEFGRRGYVEAGIYNNKLVIGPGFSRVSPQHRQDVWISEDGIVWTYHSDVDLINSYGGIITKDNCMYICGGGSYKPIVYKYPNYYTGTIKITWWGTITKLIGNIVNTFCAKFFGYSEKCSNFAIDVNTIRLDLQVYNAGQEQNKINYYFKLSNNGENSIPISNIKIYSYIYTDYAPEEIKVLSEPAEVSIYDSFGNKQQLLGNWKAIITEIPEVNCGYYDGLERRANRKIVISYIGNEVLPPNSYLAGTTDNSKFLSLKLIDNSNISQLYDYSSMKSLMLTNKTKKEDAIDYPCFVLYYTMNNTDNKLCEFKSEFISDKTVQTLNNLYLDLNSGKVPCFIDDCFNLIPTVTRTFTITPTYTITITLTPTITPTYTPGYIIWSSNTHKIITTVITSVNGIQNVTWRQDFIWYPEYYNVLIQPRKMPNNAKIRFKKNIGYITIWIIDDFGNPIDCSTNNAILDIFVDYDLKKYNF